MYYGGGSPSDFKPFNLAQAYKDAAYVQNTMAQTQLAQQQIADNAAKMQARGNMVEYYKQQEEERKEQQELEYLKTVMQMNTKYAVDRYNKTLGQKYGEMEVIKQTKDYAWARNQSNGVMVGIDTSTGETISIDPRDPKYQDPAALQREINDINSQIEWRNAQTKKADKETERIEKLIPAEVEAKEAQAESYRALADKRRQASMSSDFKLNNVAGLLRTKKDIVGKIQMAQENLRMGMITQEQYDATVNILQADLEVCDTFIEAARIRMGLPRGEGTQPQPAEAQGGGGAQAPYATVPTNVPQVQVDDIATGTTLPKPSVPNQRITKQVVDIYVRAHNGDRAAAKEAAREAGWSFKVE